MNIKRFYRKDFPEMDDIVIVRIGKQSDYGYNVSLLEYEELEGFLSLSELVKGKYLKKSQMLKSDDIMPLIVKESNVAKKMVELSRKNLKEEEVSDTMIRYKTCTCINRLMNECYTMYLKYCDLSSSDIIHGINDVMDTTVWRLYEETEDIDYNTIYMKILEHPDIILPPELFTQEFIDKALQNIHKRINKTNMILEMTLNLSLMEEDAVTKIKEILNVTLNEPDLNVKVVILSPPLYKIRIESSDKKKGYDALENVKKTIQERINKYSNILKFADACISCDSSYDIKFLADFDLKRLEL